MRAFRGVLSILLLAACAGCATTGRPSVGPSGASAASPPGGSPSLASTAAATPLAEEPPVARLAVEGGDSVTGQLGTFIWRDGGTDSPWLPGAPITIGAGEPLSIDLDPAIGVASWRARFVPATADGPDGATVLGEGTGRPAFPSPEPGAWTVEVHVVFADALGDASYFWRVEAR